MTDLAQLFRRDLTRLGQELRAFPNDETLWRVAPGISNPAGNLTLHLEGNLREYIGRQLGGGDYSRNREYEFAAKGLPASDLIARIDTLQPMIPDIVAGLTVAQLNAAHPEPGRGSTRAFLLHLFGHFNYHLGQIDYVRRVLTSDGAVTFAQL